MKEFCADFPSGVEGVGRIRRAVVQFAQCCGIDRSTLSDIEYAIGEALANAAEHGHDEGAFIFVKAMLDGGALIIEIKDSGRGFANWKDTTHKKPVSTSPRGFGIFLMRSLMDEVEYSQGGTCIRLVKFLPNINTDGYQKEA